MGIGSLTLIDSTVSGNSAAQGGGGGIYSLGLPNGAADVVVRNSTISGNGALAGGAIYNAGTSLTIVDSSLAENSAGNGSAIFQEILSPSILIERSIIDGSCGWSNDVLSSSGGWNLEGPGDTCGLALESDQVAVSDLGIGTLANNGGPTWTHALLSGSPAIDAAGVGCSATDQRGFSRPQDGDFDGAAVCDAGAFEGLGQGINVEVPSLGAFGLSLLVVLLALTGLDLIRRV